MDDALYKAAVEGNIICIENLRQKINQVTAEDGKTILHLASEFGKIECIRFIVAEFANENFLIKADKKQRTALHWAALKGRVHAVELLINLARGLLSSEFEKFCRHGDCSGDTALHMAVGYNHLEVFKVLLKADPDSVYSQNQYSHTPLHAAARLGRIDIVKVICGFFSTPTLNAPAPRRHIGDLVLMRDDIGWTAMDCAASTHLMSVLDILVQFEINQFHDLTKYKQFFMERPNKEIGLHRAACNGHISTVLRLIKLYPDFIWCAVNGGGQNILHLAVGQNHKELVQGILHYCPDISLILNTKDEQGNTPLHLLVMRGCFIPELIRHEVVGINAKNNDDFTPYDLLYLDDEIVADQLKIKDAFEDSQFINQRWNYGLRKSNSELITAESPVFPSTRYAKDAKFKKARDLLIKEEINLYRARINTQIIVTALITTVTFTVGFTMPGGYHQSGEKDEGSAVLSKKTAFNVFILADTLALLLSMSSLALYFVASMYQDAEEISKLVDASTLLNIVSVVATMLTFVMGIYVVLPHSSALVISVSVMSGFFLLLVILLMIKVMKDPIEKFRE